MKDHDIKRLSLLSLIIGKKKMSSVSSYDSIVSSDLSNHLTSMLATSPLTEDLYLCETTSSQLVVEKTIRQIYEKIAGQKDDLSLNENLHLNYLERYLASPLPSPYYVLDSSHTWMIYWLVNAKVLLSRETPDSSLKSSISSKISSLIVDNGSGGVAGGPNDLIGHVASTYAAVLALVLIENYECLSKIRANLYKWFMSLKHADGSFAMHFGGERDTRSTYCVLVVASILNILTPELIENTRDWIISCQTYEGGFAGIPDAESHGGYTYCALAALVLIPRDDTLQGVQIESLLHWLTARQLSLEGGFSGRTNKLVDACYSFWIGACFCILESHTSCSSLFERLALKSYILNCCQDLKFGGLRDKPGKSSDFYHTNYALCGLSIADHRFSSKKLDGYHFDVEEDYNSSAHTLPVNPIFGLPLGYAEKGHEYFNESSKAL